MPNEMLLTIVILLNEMITKVSGNYPREGERERGKGKGEYD